MSLFGRPVSMQSCQRLPCLQTESIEIDVGSNELLDEKTCLQGF